MVFAGDQAGVVRGAIVPVPNKQTAGVYIFQSVYGHTVVGPTNIRQTSKERFSKNSPASHLIYLYLRISTLANVEIFSRISSLS